MPKITGNATPLLLCLIIESQIIDKESAWYVINELNIPKKIVDNNRQISTINLKIKVNELLLILSIAILVEIAIFTGNAKVIDNLSTIMINSPL